MAVNGSSAVMAAPTSAVDPQVAEAMAMSARLQPLKNALGLQDFTDQEMDLFAMVALRMRLDPFAKEIYAVKRKGKVTFQTGIDGFRRTADDTGEYRGSDEPQFGPMVPKPYPHPEWARVVVHRQHPDGTVSSQSATAHWDEFVADAGQSGNGDLQWRRMPRVMLAKCAEAQAFRKLFPKRFGQVYVSEEMQQADAAAAATPVQATVTTHRAEIAAQRAAAEARTTSAPMDPGAATGASAQAAPAAVASPEPVTPGDGEDDAVIEGTAVEVAEDAEPGINAGELRDALRERLIGISAARARAKGLFDRDELDKLTDAQRGALLADLDRDPPK